MDTNWKWIKLTEPAFLMLRDMVIAETNIGTFSMADWALLNKKILPEFGLLPREFGDDELSRIDLTREDWQRIQDSVA